MQEEQQGRETTADLETTCALHVFSGNLFSLPHCFCWGPHKLCSDPAGILEKPKLWSLPGHSAETFSLTQSGGTMTRGASEDKVRKGRCSVHGQRRSCYGTPVGKADNRARSVDHKRSLFSTSPSPPSLTTTVCARQSVTPLQIPSLALLCCVHSPTSPPYRLPGKLRLITTQGQLKRRGNSRRAVQGFSFGGESDHSETSIVALPHFVPL